MDFLTKEQQASFAATNALLGLGPKEFTAELSKKAQKALSSKVIMSDDPSESDYLPHIISVASIQDLRRLSGMPPIDKVPKNSKSNPDKEPDYPPPPTAKDIKLLDTGKANFRAEMDKDLRDRIGLAAHAYILGNPHKVRAYVPLINAAHFPGKATVFTGSELIVNENTVHIIQGDDPVILNYGKITVKKNAAINVHAHICMNTQIFNQE